MITQEKDAIILQMRQRRERIKRRAIRRRVIPAIITAAAVMAGAAVTVFAGEVSITEINEFTGTSETVRVYTLIGGSVRDFLDKSDFDIGEMDKINPPADSEVRVGEDIVIMRGKEITIVADGVECGAVVTRADARDALAEAGYNTSETDEVVVSNGTDLTHSDRIELVTVEVTEEVSSEELEPEVQYVDDPDLTAGETRVVDEGKPGVREIRSAVTYRSGTETSREVIFDEVTAEPVPRVVAVGTKPSEYVIPVMAAGSIRISDSDGTINGMKYSRKINMTATAYSTSPSENGGYTVSAMGNQLGYGIAAIDPSVVPLGSKIYVTSADGSWSYGIASAEDTGGAIKGNRIDLCYEGSVREVNMFGRRECIVYILE